MKNRGHIRKDRKRKKIRTERMEGPEEESGSLGGCIRTQHSLDLPTLKGTKDGIDRVLRTDNLSRFWKKKRHYGRKKVR